MIIGHPFKKGMEYSCSLPHSFSFVRNPVDFPVTVATSFLVAAIEQNGEDFTETEQSESILCVIYVERH